MRYSYYHQLVESQLKVARILYSVWSLLVLQGEGHRQEPKVIQFRLYWRGHLILFEVFVYVYIVLALVNSRQEYRLRWSVARVTYYSVHSEVSRASFEPSIEFLLILIQGVERNAFILQGSYNLLLPLFAALSLYDHNDVEMVP